MCLVISISGLMSWVSSSSVSRCQAMKEGYVTETHEYRSNIREYIVARQIKP